MTNHLNLKLLLASAVWAARAAHEHRLSFLVVGDWGGDYHHRDPVTDDCPVSKAQLETAKGMATVASRINASFVVSVGDNIYEDGVPNVHSHRFQTLFEDVYNIPPLSSTPFYLVAGNHDHDGNISAQIDYSNISPRWKFPDTHHAVSRSWIGAAGDAITLELIFIDTIELGGDDDSCKANEAEKAQAQWRWLETRLASSTANFLWVVGHYPIYSAGPDGSTACLVKKLLPLLSKHGAHYMNGHDHMLEHLSYDGVHMVVSGAGMECCYPPRRRASVPAEAFHFMVSGRQGRGPRIGGSAPPSVQGGFASMRFFDDHMVLFFHTEQGDDIYNTTIGSRKSRQQVELDFGIIV